ncbi:hypothetical protein P691DRAFT_782565 [Macrolepiota fuliginosa MF-IS2]|uniref:Uncharacterized protein n=1 Tax=Macrolepiota fuliginosa MF-IS2 TaxID=1400762 RepID=A0A9P5XD18_9AGAR|nr:hypothetical protein P691DRAFT_782565 [Macrolepiota fuliginosa MF-IS2]
MAPKPGSPAQSRQPSQERGPGPSARSRSRRGRSRTRRSPSVASTISDSGDDQAPLYPQNESPVQSRPKKRKNKKRQSGLPVVDEVEGVGREVANTASGAVDTVGGAASSVAGSGGGSGDKPLKLRLDLNLDADIRLTAKVHGDITLSLL